MFNCGFQLRHVTGRPLAETRICVLVLRRAAQTGYAQNLTSREVKRSDFSFFFSRSRDFSGRMGHRCPRVIHCPNGNVKARKHVRVRFSPIYSTRTRAQIKSHEGSDGLRPPIAARHCRQRRQQRRFNPSSRSKFYCDEEIERVSQITAFAFALKIFFLRKWLSVILSTIEIRSFACVRKYRIAVTAEMSF